MYRAAASDLPQLLGRLDAGGEYVLGGNVGETLRNLKKSPTPNENQIIDTGFIEYESVPRLDNRAFRYVVRDGKLFFAESVSGLGGLRIDTVLTPIGEWTEGTETNPDLTEIMKIKAAKDRHRKRQLEENERLAGRYLAAVRAEIKTASVHDGGVNGLVSDWQNELNDIKRFVRPGKPDYNASRMEILSKHAGASAVIAGIVDKYHKELDEKNQKWATARLRTPKVIKNAIERVGLEKREDIGEINPEVREEFNEYYQTRAGEIEPYVIGEEEITADVPKSGGVVAIHKKSAEVSREKTAAVMQEKTVAQPARRETPAAPTLHRDKVAETEVLR
jgi:hypothetical protein